jgi:hypothetical protein
MLPEALDWIEFGTIGRLKDRNQVFRPYQRFGSMSLGLIHLHDGYLIAQGVGYRMDEALKMRPI